MGADLGLNVFFRNEEDEYEINPFKPKLTFNPRNVDTSIEVYLSCLEDELLNVSAYGSNYSNLTVQEQEALRNLKNDNAIIIKEADKGSGVVIWDREDYLKEADNHLLDSNFYSEYISETDPLSLLKDKITQALDKIKERGDIDNQTLNYLMVNNPRLGRFYLLPKIHKRLPGVPGRPVISNCSYSTENIAKFLDFHIQPLSKKVNSYLKDTTDFLRKIKALGPLPDNAILVTMDVVGLYPNIPHEGGLKALENALNRREDQSINTTSLMELAELALKNNYFEHVYKIYKQEQGTAIGAKFAPSYAIVYMGEFEENAIDGFPLKPWVWWRYIDDVFMIWEYGEETLNEFVEHLNGLDPNIKFERPLKYSKVAIDFLDVTVTRVDDRLKTDLYTKPTDTHQYLEFSSCHPWHCKKSIPYSQALRLRRICSEEGDFVIRTSELKQYLYDRGYEKKLVDDQIDKASKVNRDLALQEKEPRVGEDRDVLVLTYHPALSKKVYDIINKNHHILSLGSERSKVFSRTPMIAFRQPKSLRDLLVRAIVKTQTSEPNECRGCNGRSDCQVCKLLVHSDKFSNKTETRSYNLRKGSLHCNSKNVIYLMTCQTCQKQYIGSTVTKFRERVNNYKSKFRLYYKRRKAGTLNKSDPIEQAQLFAHFVDHGNVKGFDNSRKKGEDWSFWSFQLIDSSPNEPMLLQRESFWQYELGTFMPEGLNERDVAMIAI